MPTLLEVQTPSGAVHTLSVPRLPDGPELVRWARALLPFAEPGLSLVAEAAGLGPGGRVMVAVAFRTAEKALAE